jgi:hypothetical protein
VSVEKEKIEKIIRMGGLIIFFERLSTHPQNSDGCCSCGVQLAALHRGAEGLVLDEVMEQRIHGIDALQR